MSNFDETLIKLSFAAGYIYMLLAITGILLNTYVIVRLVQLAVHDYQRFKRGSGLPLAAMSISDLCSLISIIVAVIISGFLPPSLFSPQMHTALCKLTTYMIHTLTGFSTWCWLFISALRYIAVYHPLWHITGKTLGPRTIVVMVIIMLLLNSWLPIVVFYFSETRSCAEKALSFGPHWNRMLHGLELLWSYVLPAILTIALDIKVIFVRPPSFVNTSNRNKMNSGRSKTPISMVSAVSGEECEKSMTNKIINIFCANSCVQKNKKPRISVLINDNDEEQTKKTSIEKFLSYRRFSRSKDDKCKIAAYAQNSWQSTCSRTGPTGSTRRGRRTVRQWLAITTIHLLLNAPDNVMRLINVLLAVPLVYTPTSHIIQLIVRLLYFAQFCFNAAYLSAIVYRRNISPERRQITPKTSNVNLQIHPDFSRPQTRVGIRDESRRQSRCHAELLRRYSADPRSLREPNLKHHTHLQVNQPLRSAPLLSSYSSIGTFKSEDLDLNSQSSIANSSLGRSPSTEPRNEISPSPMSSGDQTSAGLITFDSNGTNTPILCSRIQSAQDDWSGGKEKSNCLMPLMQENVWRI